MDSAVQHTFTVFMGFFAIMNPIANVPIFLGLTGDDDRQTSASVALRSLLLAFIIVTLFAIAGKIIFHLFGLTLPAFRITGGLIVFIIGYHMLRGNPSSLHHPEEASQPQSRKAALSVAVSPLAMPILAGPGTIATAMSFSAGGGMRNISITIIAFAVLCVITYVFFMFGAKFVSYIGTSALGAITRMMGLILAVIGTQMVIGGLHGAFTVLH
ncbi:MAG: MarC family protein [Gammaproteobacteria bacterium]|jgi:multiple antibiotic resistance protein